MEQGKVIRVSNACITRLENSYRFGYDGYRVELTPDEAHEFYLRIDRVLSTYSTDFKSLSIMIKEQHYIVYREQLLTMMLEMRADDRAGKALWYN